AERAGWSEWFPADLIKECFPGPFRNWFYALLAMGTMMERTAPFRVLLGHALVRDEHGEEMHKSWGNAIWFDDAAEKMGADVMRWMYAGANPTQNMNFGYGLGEDVKRNLLTLWNTYSFFCMYANLDGYDPSKGSVPVAERPELDKWIVARLNE